MYRITDSTRTTNPALTGERGAGILVSREWACLIAVLTLLACAAVNANPAEDATLEEKVKAAYLFNFAKFITWPKQAFSTDDAPIVVGVVANDSFAAAVEEAVKDKSVGGRAFQVKRFKKAAEVEATHIRFIGTDASADLATILEKLKKSPVVTVGEQAELTNKGGVIRFYIHEGKLRFEINIDAARRAELSISAKLLQLASIFREGGRS